MHQESQKYFAFSSKFFLLCSHSFSRFTLKIQFEPWCNTKLSYFKLIAFNHTVQPLLLKTSKRNLKKLISELLFFVFQSHIPFSPLWIWEHVVFTLLCRLKYPLNLSPEQQNFLSELPGKIK